MTSFGGAAKLLTRALVDNTHNLPRFGDTEHLTGASQGQVARFNIRVHHTADGAGFDAAMQIIAGRINIGGRFGQAQETGVERDGRNPNDQFAQVMKAEGAIVLVAVFDNEPPPFLGGAPWCLGGLPALEGLANG